MNISAYHKMLAAVGLAIATTIGAGNLFAQTANWNNGAADNDWNTAGNWDIGVPAEGTNAIIPIGNTVNYNAPMTATSFAGVNNSGALSVNSSGFNIDAVGQSPYIGGIGGSLTIGASGAFLATNGGAWAVSSNNFVSVDGGSLIITNGTNVITFGPNGNQSAANAAGFTNNGGNVVFNQQFQLRGRFSRFHMTGGTLDLQGGGGVFESSNDQERLFLINSGTANLGNFSVTRTVHSVGLGGLVVSNGVVNATSLQIGNNASRASSTIFGGVLTNTGSFTICDRSNGAVTGERRVFFYVRGGSVYSSGSAGIIVANQGNAGLAAPGSSVIGGFLDVNAGLLVTEKITLVKDNTLTNAHATLTLSGTGTIYLGSGGLLGNNQGPTNTTYTVTLSGGTLAAKDDFSINANANVSGALTVKASDLGNNARNITNNSVWSGSGSLTKTGGGVLTLNSNNTYAGATTISEGTLALGATGTITNSSTFNVASGATFDVSTPGGFTLGDAKTLAGLGTVTGNFTSASNATINPGTGTLTITGSLNQSGGAKNHLDLPTTPGPGNDRINIGGDLNVSGVNTIEVNGGGAPGTVHTLIQYGGTFNGTLANFNLTGATAILSNNAPTKTIALIIQSATRNPTNVVWVGNATTNDWDAVNTTNWLSGAGITYFVTGDNVLFDNTGIANPNVNLVGNVEPASLVIGASGNYSFSGSGSIGGTVGLTKTNTGTLTVNAVNSYSGVTLISGGVLEAGSVANGNLNSAIGSAATDSANLVINGGVLRYIGATASTDRGATIGTANGTVDVNAATTLTVSGVVTGAGALIKDGSGTLALGGANNFTGGTILSNGLVQVNAAGAFAGGGVTNYGGGVRGPNSTVTVVNEVEVNGTMTIDAANSSGDFHLTGAWHGNGTISIINFPNAARTVTLGGGGSGGGSMANFTGTIDMGTSGGHLRFNDGGGNNNLGNPAMTLNMGTGAGDFTVRNGGVTVEFGALTGGPNTTVTGRASGASGTVTYSVGALNLDTTYEGNIRNGNNATALTKVGNGKLTLTGTSTYTGLTTVNAGILQVDGALSGTPTLTVFGGTLSGNGSIAGSVDIQPGGILSPGASIGKLTISSSLTFQSGSTNIMEINKALGTNDSIMASASISYSGTLVVNNLAGTLADGDSFKLFDTATYGGVHEFLELPALGTDLFWNTSTLAVDGTIRVFTPRPAITGNGVDGNNLFLTGTNGGNASTHYIIVTSTDVTTPLAGWTPVVTNTFDGGGNFAFTNAINTAEPARFYNVKTP